jgi:RND family efflux transporter MFP subunit
LIEQQTRWSFIVMQKFFKFVLPVLLVVTSIAVVAVLVVLQKGKGAERKPDVEQGILVDAITAEVSSLNFTVTSQGTVRPRTETSLVSEVSGKIVSVNPDFVAGGFFRKGDVLLEIDPSDYLTGLKRAEAALASRHAKLADETARSEQALKDWKNLGKQGEPSDLGLRLPQLEDAKANVSAAEADVQKAKRDLERTRITLPYDGLVRQKAVDIGQYVTPGTRLATTFAIDTAEVRLPLSQSDLNFLHLPSETEINAAGKSYPPVVLSAQNGARVDQWQARIIRTEGVVDEASRVIYAVAQIVDPYAVLGKSSQKELKIGTFVEAEIQGLVAENVVVLPRFVLRADNTVLALDEEDRLKVLPVEVLRAEPKEVYISSGIEDGTRVITTTLDAPLPGIQMKLNKPKTTAADENQP